jgi:hypothetical protein
MKKWRFAGERLGVLCTDLGKLIFGSLVLGTTLKGEVNPYQLFAGGIISAVFMLVAGLVFSVLAKE